MCPTQHGLQVLMSEAEVVSSESGWHEGLTASRTGSSWITLKSTSLGSGMLGVARSPAPSSSAASLSCTPG